MEEVDVLIIGAGISGIGAAYHVSRKTNFTFKVLESKPTFGGTWELFKYPGIRSDSDMYSFAFSFHPWMKEQRFGSAKEIKDYLQDVLTTYSLEKYILYNQKVCSASFSTATNRWITKTEGGNTWNSKYIYFCTGYYDHDEGYTPDFKGMNDFNGEIIHPQKWPEGKDLSGKNVIVIGSGATAVTVVPAICETAKVTMLQRSPTYMVPLADKEPLWLLQRLLVRIFGKKMKFLLFKIRRISNVLMQYIFYWMCKTFPSAIKTLYLKCLSWFLGRKEVQSNWTPRYNPWDQRVCCCPEADFHRMIKEKKATIVTDNISKFTPSGIALESGKELEADVIVTATGLKLSLAGKIQLSIDSQPIKPHESYFYRGAMLSDLPNAFIMFGYTNASWTLKVDLVADWACRLCNYVEKNNFKTVTPTNPKNTADFQEVEALDMTSSYIQRYKNLMPRTGNRTPWTLKQDYYFDSLQFSYGDLTRELKFE